MKRIFLILITILFLSTPAFAGERLLDGVSATGVSSEASFPVSGHNTSRQAAECHYTDANGSISALVFEIEITLDPPSIKPADATWYSVATHEFDSDELTAKKAIMSLSEATNRRARINITTLTGVQVGTDLIYATFEYNY